MNEPSELTQLRNVVARARELIEEGHHSTSGPCETCKAFIVLINSVPASLAEGGEQTALVEASNLRNAIRQSLAIIGTRRYSNILADSALSLVIRTLEESLAAPSRAPEQKCQHLRVIEQARQAKEGETPNNTGGWMWPPVCQDCGEELPFGTPETMPHDFVAPSRAEGLARECNSCGRNHPSSVCPEWNAPKAVPSRAPEEVLDSTHDEGCECRTSRKETAVCICDFSAPSRAPEQKTESYFQRPYT